MSGDPVAWRSRSATEQWHYTNDRLHDRDGARSEPSFVEEPLYSRAATEAKIEALKDALEHVTELLVDTWHAEMTDDPERSIAVLQARAALQATVERERSPRRSRFSTRQQGLDVRNQESEFRPVCCAGRKSEAVRGEYIERSYLLYEVTGRGRMLWGGGANPLPHEAH